MNTLNMLHPTYEYIRQLILDQKKRPLSIIDYGCGNGLLIEVLGTQNIQLYHGFDISSQAVRVAQQSYLGNSKLRFSKINSGTIGSLGKKRSCDAVVLIGVLQYLNKKELQELFQQSHRVLKKGGKIILSCAVYHKLYAVMNLYSLFLPHSYIFRKDILRIAQKNKLTVELAREKGLFIAPFIANCFIVFFDILDKIIWRKKGELGYIGKFVRAISVPLIRLEYHLPIDYGYTLFIVLKK